MNSERAIELNQIESTHSRVQSCSLLTDAWPVARRTGRQLVLSVSITISQDRAISKAIKSTALLCCCCYKLVVSEISSMFLVVVGWFEPDFKLQRAYAMRLRKPVCLENQDVRQRLAISFSPTNCYGGAARQTEGQTSSAGVLSDKPSFERHTEDDSVLPLVSQQPLVVYPHWLSEVSRRLRSSKKRTNDRTTGNA